MPARISLLSALLATPILLDIGPGASIHGPVTFKNEKGEIIFHLDATGFVVTKPTSGNTADKERTR